MYRAPRQPRLVESGRRRRVLHDGVVQRCARDPVVPYTATVGEDQFCPGVVRQVAGQIHLVLEVAAAELTVIRIARTMGPLQHDGDDVGNNEVGFFVREESCREVDRIGVLYAARNGAAECGRQPEVEVTGDALEVDAGVGNDLLRIRADGAVAVFVPAAVPGVIAPQRQARARRQAIVVGENHPHTDRARGAVRPNDRGAVRLRREHEGAARRGRDGRAVRRDARERQRAQWPGVGL